MDTGFKLAADSVSGRNSVFLRYRRQARQRHFDWRLSKQEFTDLISGSCTYCGCPPKTKLICRGHRFVYLYNGIDRKDPLMGYVRGNVVSCCGACNDAKGTMSYDEWSRWVERLVLYQIEHPFSVVEA